MMKENVVVSEGHRGSLVATLGMHVVMLVATIAGFSPSVDEVSHLPSGLSYWRFSRFDLYRVNPPLVDAVAAGPLLFCELEEDWSRYYIDKNSRQEFPVGKQFVELNGADSIRLYRYGRLAKRGSGGPAVAAISDQTQSVADSDTAIHVD
jgi:hypothetical protein